jgi:hypothetical protein
LRPASLRTGDSEFPALPEGRITGISSLEFPNAMLSRVQVPTAVRTFHALSTIAIGLIMGISDSWELEKKILESFARRQAGNPVDGPGAGQ